MTYLKIDFMKFSHHEILKRQYMQVTKMKMEMIKENGTVSIKAYKTDDNGRLLEVENALITAYPPHN